MNNKVKFLRGTSDEYTVAEKDNDTIYFTTDDGKLYIGDKEILGKSIKALNSHINDSVKHITSTERTNWNAAKTHADSPHAPSNAQANVIETVKVNGTALTPSSKAVDITVPSYSTMTGATSSTSGTSGLVPAPTVDDITKFLCGDGTWKTPDSSGGGTAYPMPYFVQSGTVTIDKSNIRGISITFPVKFKSAPLVLISSQPDVHSNVTAYTNYYPSIVNVREVTATDFKLFAWRGSSSSASEQLAYAVPANWIAFGKI